jgi:hypothetical protein
MSIPIEETQLECEGLITHLQNATELKDTALSLHAYVEISIKPLEMGHDVIRVMARVTRNLEGGVGVEWCEFAPSAVTDLLRSPSF